MTLRTLLSPLPLLLLGCAALLLSGCASLRKTTVKPPPPPQNYFAPDTDGTPMRRVALLPLWSERVPAGNLRDLDAAFAGELSKKALFEVVPVSRSRMESLFGQPQFASTEALPADLLEKLREQFGVEGILLIDLTHFSSYRPVAIGVRTKLLDVTTGDIRWAFDYVYDSGHPAIAEAARRYQLQYSNEQQPLKSDGGSILLSPTRFAKYVAAETFGSLQAR